MATLRDEWASFRERVIDPNAPPIQLEVMQDAFYAGAAALYTLLMRGVSEGPDSKPEDEAFLQALEVEMREFGSRRGVELALRRTKPS